MKREINYIISMRSSVIDMIKFVKIFKRSDGSYS